MKGIWLASVPCGNFRIMVARRLTILLLLVFAPLAATAAEQQAPSIAKLVESIRTGDEKARETALEEIRQRESLSEQDKDLLFAVCQDAKLPAEVRYETFEFLWLCGGAMPQFVEPLLKMARNSQEPEAMRNVAVTSLQLIVQVSDRSPAYDQIRRMAPGLMPTTTSAPASTSAVNECLRAISDIAKDKSEPSELRRAALCSLSQLPDLNGRACTVLKFIAADREESEAVREIALEGASVYVSLAREHALEIFQSTLRVASDKSERQTIRLLAWHSLCQQRMFRGPNSWMFEHETFWQGMLHNLAHGSDEIGFWKASEDLSRAIFKVMADPTEEQKIREVAGFLLRLLPRIDHSQIPDLVELLQSDAAFLRDEAVAALGSIGIPARRTAPALLTVWLDASQTPEVSDAAGEALFSVDRRTAMSLGLEE